MSEQRGTPTALEADYSAVVVKAQDFAYALVGQINTLLQGARIYLASPLESRVKNLTSILEKVERKALGIKKVEELDDLIGVRVMLLFIRDVKITCDLIESNFEVKEREDASTRLAENQLGYSSMHYIVEFPEAWLAVPSLARYRGMRAEVQIRTMAQHIWAASEHVLQYKTQESIPKDLRRAIYRASAFLESVDLEFERVLEQRDRYRASLQDTNKPISEDTLNVDLLAKILDEELPPESKSSDGEDYGALLSQLQGFGIDSVGKLRELIIEQKDAMRQDEALRIEEAREEVGRGETPTGTDVQRVRRGVYYTHVGLARSALQARVGKRAYFRSMGLNIGDD